MYGFHYLGIYFIESNELKIMIAIIVGAISYVILGATFNFFMMKIFKYEALSAYDSLVLMDDEKIIANIVGTLFFEKFEFEEMRDYLEERTSEIHKCRSKLSKRFGLWWYAEM
jgi:hypothetical protein